MFLRVLAILALYVVLALSIRPSCKFHHSNLDNSVLHLYCYYLNITPDTDLLEHLKTFDYGKEPSIWASYYPYRNHSFAVGSSMADVIMMHVTTNFTIDTKLVSNFPNLTTFKLSGEGDNHLDVNVDAFKNAPNLNRFSFTFLEITPNVLLALEKIADREDLVVEMTYVRLSDGGDQSAIFRTISRLNKMKEVKISRGCRDEDVIPKNMFRNSAATLETISVHTCKPEGGRLTSEWFRGMNNLTWMVWENSTITAEVGTFEGLTKLETQTVS